MLIEYKIMTFGSFFGGLVHGVSSVASTIAHGVEHAAEAAVDGVEEAAKAVAHAAEEAAKAVAGEVVDAAKDVVKLGGKAGDAALALSGVANGPAGLNSHQQHALDRTMKNINDLGGAAGILPRGPSKKGVEKGGNGSSGPTKQHGGKALEVLPDGTTVKDADGGHHVERPLKDEKEEVAKRKKEFESNYAKLWEMVKALRWDKEPQVNDMPSLGNYTMAEITEWVKWANAEKKQHKITEEQHTSAALAAAGKKQEEIEQLKITDIRRKIAKRCDPSVLGELKGKSAAEHRKILDKCSKAKRDKDFAESEVLRKEEVAKSKEGIAAKKLLKEKEVAAKAAAIAAANKEGIKLSKKGATSNEVLAEIDLNKQYPLITARVLEFFNKKNEATKGFLDKFHSTVENRKKLLETNAKNYKNTDGTTGTTVAKMLELWGGDYVGKMVNDYIKQYLVRDPNGKEPPYAWFIHKTPVPANDTTLPYTEKLRKLIIKARRYKKRNLPIKYLGMKLADNEFLKPPKFVIGGKAKGDKREQKRKDALAKEAAVTKANLDRKKVAGKKVNDAIEKADKAAAAAAAATPEALKAAGVAAVATENQKADPGRDFIADALKKGDATRYDLTTEKDNRDYAIDSLLAKLAYESNRPSQVFGNWKYLTAESTDETAIYVNSQEQKIKMAFKGTNSGKEMIGVDFFSIALSPTMTNMAGIDKHFQSAIKLFNEIRTGSYNTYEISLTGHSLGARTAVVVAQYEQALYKTVAPRLRGTKRKKDNNLEALGGKVIKGAPRDRTHVSGFATGSGTENFIDSIITSIKKQFSKTEKTNYVAPQIQLYRLTGDALSGLDWGRGANTNIYKVPRQATNAHTILNFVHKDFWTTAEKQNKSKTNPSLRGGPKPGGRGLEETAQEKAAKAALKAAKKAAKAAQKKSDGEVWYDKPDV